MHKDVMADAGLGLLAQISLILFVLAFVLIMLRTFLMKKEKKEHIKELPLDDGEIDQPVKKDDRLDDDRHTVEGSKSQ